jgi:hypothetical protein
MWQRIKLTGRLVVPAIPTRPVYESTVIVPPKLWELDANAPVFGGEQWEKQCGRKYAFFTLEAAQKVFVSVKHRFYKRKRVLMIYQCPWCDWWHLGHKKESGVWHEFHHRPKH